jgi:hypothetical protein
VDSLAGQQLVPIAGKYLIGMDSEPDSGLRGKILLAREFEKRRDI